MIQFKKAERQQAKLRLAFSGPSGSGKTFSALLVASGIGGKIALIDTENHSASLYAGEDGIPPFDTLEIEPPYTITKYVDGIKSAVANGYNILVIDSITHAWAGEGGLLEKKGALDMRGGNSYTNWAPVTKEHELFKSMLLNCDINLIVTMRSKQDYVLEQNERGKSVPKKVGLAPIQREGMEYEFALVLDMGMDHQASVTKARIRGFDGRIFKPTKKTGEELVSWLREGKEIQATETKSVHPLEAVKAAFLEKGVPVAAFEDYVAGLPFEDNDAVKTHMREIFNQITSGKKSAEEIFALKTKGETNGNATA